ncbi:MAG: hypothetical protein K940chlam7_00137 [Chlamydiae bacterium]|nr:hypothetical protein [Chlamydiota bacterium]
MKYFLLTLSVLTIICVDSIFAMNEPAAANQCETLFIVEKNHKDSYGYYTFGVGPIILIPNIGIGYRQRCMRFGYDFSLSASTLIELHQIQGNAVCHYFPNPCRQDPWYFGLGVSTSFILSNHSHNAKTIAPDFVIGKELMHCGSKKHFVEAHINAPTWGSSKYSFKKRGRLDIPLMFIKYGISI